MVPTSHDGVVHKSPDVVVREPAFTTGSGGLLALESQTDVHKSAHPAVFVRCLDKHTNKVLSSVREYLYMYLKHFARER